VKRGGEAAYALARRGVDVQLEPREVTIYELELRAYEPPFLDLAVECSAGTYLRSIAHDLGVRLGTGAHLWELCRTRSGPFRLDQAVSLERLAEEGAARLIPMVDATGLPSYEVDVGVARRVAQGVQLLRSDVRGAPREGVFQLVRKGKLVALLEAEPGLPSVRTLRVFLEGTEG
jgi:tRNA pseudouridine55 synthase